MVDVEHDHLGGAPGLASDLIVPAQESAPRMKDTGPEAVPPLASGSIDPRMFERLIPEPEPPRKIMPSLVFQSRIDSIVVLDAEDEAVVNRDVVGEELARLGLDVVDVLDAERLDRDDLLLTEIRAALGVRAAQRLQQLVGLLAAREADELGEASALGADRRCSPREIVAVRGVDLVLAARVDAQKVSSSCRSSVQRSPITAKPMRALS
jgi:hypothetical protein